MAEMDEQRFVEANKADEYHICYRHETCQPTNQNIFELQQYD